MSHLRMSPEEYEARQKRHNGMRAHFQTTAPDPAPKYHNTKCEYAGIQFDSKREMRRYIELDTLQKAGEITDLQRQVKFELIPSQKRDDGTTERGVTYTSDVTYRQAGKLIVEDTKGHKTQQYILRRKLMLFVHGITVKEV